MWTQSEILRFKYLISIHIDAEKLLQFTIISLIYRIGPKSRMKSSLWTLGFKIVHCKDCLFKYL